MSTLTSPAHGGRRVYRAIRPTATQHELLAVLAQVLRIRAYLEVGVRDGHSLWPVLEAAWPETLRQLALCDTWGASDGGSNRGDHAHIEELLRTTKYFGAVLFLDGPSQEELPRLRREYPEMQFDLVHIDGCHQRDIALSDFHHGWAVTAPGGVMLAHDMDLPWTREAFEAFAETAGVAPLAIATGGHPTGIIQRPHA